MMLTFPWEDYYRGNLTWLPYRTFYLTRHGSHAYGLNTPESDLDLKGIAIPPKEYFLGYLKVFEQAESKDPDLSIYDIRKFFRLAADCNPNIIEVLFSDGEDWYFTHNFHLARKILDARSVFLSRKARHTFSGYAMVQLKRINTHHRWLLHPPQAKPERKTYELPETTLLSADILGAMDAIKEKNAVGLEEFPAHMMDLYHRERAYQNALREWQQYQNWKATRNHKRAELEARAGYDTKHASHLVRLMRMCREILTTGQVIVRRPDREELLAIRGGAWSYDQLIAWAKRQDEEMAELEQNSPLPHSPDRARLDALCQEIVGEML